MWSVRFANSCLWQEQDHISYGFFAPAFRPPAGSYYNPSRKKSEYHHFHNLKTRLLLSRKQEQKNNIILWQQSKMNKDLTNLILSFVPKYLDFKEKNIICEKMARSRQLRMWHFEPLEEVFYQTWFHFKHSKISVLLSDETIILYQRLQEELLHKNRIVHW